MKILYVCDELAIYGGLERVSVDKANWLVEHGGCEVCLVTVNQGQHPICFPLHPNVSVHDLDIRFYQQYRLPLWKRLIKKRQLYHLFCERLANKIKEQKPDIIVCTRFDFIRVVAKVKGDVPFVFESHASRLASYFDGDGLLRRSYVWYSQRAVKKAQMVVALTNGDADEWRKLTSKVCVIPNVVHLNKSGSYSDCMAKSVIFVGRFSKQKDIDSLLCIWSIVHQRHSDWSLHVYGGYGELQDVMLAEIEKLDANIQVHEPTSDIIEKYKESSIMLLTSRYEPFGLVLPEAMSCGLPVVAFDCPYGPADIITDGFDGFLVRDRNIEDYADKICSLMENMGMRTKMGRAGIQSSKRYSEDEIMPQWINVFDGISSKS
jgi:glycosyltransferase involved in cell wall biosynthesis